MIFFHLPWLYLVRGRGLAGLATFILLFGASSQIARGQEPDSERLIFDTALVQLNVGVADRQGHAITTLSQNDFVVYEDGVRQPILTFEPTETPFSLVLLLDTSGSTIAFRQQIQMAALRFLDALAPDDRVAVVQFNGKGVKSVLGFSTDRRKIAFAINLAVTTGAGATPFYEALRSSLKELAKEGKRRKAIVVLTDGIDTDARNADRAAIAKAGTDAQISLAVKPENNPLLNLVLNDAARLGVTIFPLGLPSGDPKRLPLPDPSIIAMYTAAHTRLQMLADRTGGQLNEIHRLDELAKIYAIVAADLRTLYTISYQRPNPNLRDGKWREIRIEVPRQDLVTHTKPGYFAR
jgi:VWFA-related protein